MFSLIKGKLKDSKLKFSSKNFVISHDFEFVDVLFFKIFEDDKNFRNFGRNN